MRNLRDGLLIGQLSERAGVPTQTIRYYERLGLLETPGRTASRYRVYTAEHLDRLRFVLQAKRFGLSLDEIKELIVLRCGGVEPCGHLRELVRRRLDETEQRIRELTAFRDDLQRRYDAMDGSAPAGKICGIVESVTT